MRHNTQQRAHKRFNPNYNWVFRVRQPDDYPLRIKGVAMDTEPYPVVSGL